MTEESSASSTGSQGNKIDIGNIDGDFSGNIAGRDINIFQQTINNITQVITHPRTITRLPPFDRLLVVLAVFLVVGMVIGLTFALDPFGSVTAMRRFNRPLYTTWPPQFPETGGFNIAVAGFTLDGEASVNPDFVNCGWDIGDWLATGISEEKYQHPNILATVFSPEQVGVIPGENYDTRAANAADFADQSNADIVIYGVITGSTNNYFVKPEFYVAWPGFDYGSEVAGPEQLGQQVPIYPPCDDPEKNSLNNELKARRRVLHQVTYGLGYFYYNNYAEAFEEFDDASNETAGEGLEVVHLLKGAAKMREYNDQELSRENRLQAFVEVEKSIRETLALNSDYPRGYLGLGGIAFQQATVFNPEWPNSVDQIKLRQAETYYLQSLELMNQPDLAYVFIKGNYGLGQIYTTGYHYFLCDWSGKQAKTYFSNVVNAYHEPPPAIYWFVGKAHASLAWLAMLDGDPPRAAITQAHCPQSMAFNETEWSTTVMTECQQAIDLLEQMRFNRPDNTIANCRKWMEIAAKTSP